MFLSMCRALGLTVLIFSCFCPDSSHCCFERSPFREAQGNGFPYSSLRAVTETQGGLAAHAVGEVSLGAVGGWQGYGRYHLCICRRVCRCAHLQSHKAECSSLHCTHTTEWLELEGPLEIT